MPGPVPKTGYTVVNKVDTVPIHVELIDQLEEGTLRKSYMHISVWKERKVKEVFPEKGIFK